MEFTMNLENLYQERELEHTERLFEIETEYMAAQGFFQNAEAHRLRQMAIVNIKQLVETPGLDYDPFVPFLALTYFDRCASWHPIPDDLEFLTTFVYSCTVLAWKMRSSDFSVRLLLDEVEDLKRMEQRNLDALDWKMLSITAVFFIDFFVSLIVVHDNDPRKILPVVNPRRILNHVFFMHYHTEFTRFKPSIIAAVGVVAERSEKGPPGDSCVDPILRCKFVDMDEFENCFDLLRIKRATEIANAAFIPRIDFPESPSPPAQQEEQEEDSEEDTEEEEEAEEIANAAVIHGVRRGGRKRRRVVIGEKAEVLSYGRASVNPF